VSEKTPPIREPLKILYQTQFRGKGLAIGVDSFNWVVVHFDQGQCPLDSRQRWYFSSLPNMLLALHKYFVKERVKRLGFLDMAKVVKLSYKQVEKLGLELVLEIVRQVPHGALARFQGDHILLIDKGKKQPQRA